MNFKLPESLQNRCKSIPLDQEIHLQKNPIRKNYFFLGENPFSKKSSEIFVLEKFPGFFLDFFDIWYFHTHTIGILLPKFARSNKNLGFFDQKCRFLKNFRKNVFWKSIFTKKNIIFFDGIFLKWISWSWKIDLQRFWSDSGSLKFAI